MLEYWRRVKIENELLYLFLNNRVAQIAAVVALLSVSVPCLPRSSRQPTPMIWRVSTS